MQEPIQADKSKKDYSAFIVGFVSTGSAVLLFTTSFLGNAAQQTTTHDSPKTNVWFFTTALCIFVAVTGFVFVLTRILMVRREQAVANASNIKRAIFTAFSDALDASPLNPANGVQITSPRLEWMPYTPFDADEAEAASYAPGFSPRLREKLLEERLKEKADREQTD